MIQTSTGSLNFRKNVEIQKIRIMSFVAQGFQEFGDQIIITGLQKAIAFTSWQSALWMVANQRHGKCIWHGKLSDKRDPHFAGTNLEKTNCHILQKFWMLNHPIPATSLCDNFAINFKFPKCVKLLLVGNYVNSHTHCRIGFGKWTKD